MALTVDADWFQLRFFITGNQIIISDQFVSPVCSSVMNFSIVTTSALFCDSMIAEIAQIGDVRKIPCREIFSAGDSCLYGPYALILNCFVISAVHCSIRDDALCPFSLYAFPVKKSTKRVKKELSTCAVNSFCCIITLFKLRYNIRVKIRRRPTSPLPLLS